MDQGFEKVDAKGGGFVKYKGSTLYKTNVDTILDACKPPPSLEEVKI